MDGDSSWWRWRMSVSWGCRLRGVMRMDVDTAICRSNSQGMIDRCATQDQEIVWCLKGWYGFTKLSIAERSFCSQVEEAYQSSRGSYSDKVQILDFDRS